MVTPGTGRSERAATRFDGMQSLGALGTVGDALLVVNVPMFMFVGKGLIMLIDIELLHFDCACSLTSSKSTF
jgi:hypothetical protein